MLSVTLTLTNPDKAAKLLALLEELPFVEIQERQEIQPPVTTSLLDLFNRYLEHQNIGFESEIWTGPIQINIFSGIKNALRDTYGEETLKEIYLQLAQDPGFFESQAVVSGEYKAYCVYRKGFRILYVIDNEFPSTLNVFHIAKVPASTEQ